MQLSDEQILAIAKDAAAVAASVINIGISPNTSAKGNRYSVALIDDPDIEEDGLFETTENQIQINTALLKPLPGSGGKETETLRTAMNICYIVYHEMRHFYQKRAVEAYMINIMLGGGAIPALENKKRCAQWKAEMEAADTAASEEKSTSDIEEDANAFADYLISRYPIPNTMSGAINKRKVASMKRKYDKRPVPETPHFYYSLLKASPQK